MTAQAVAALGGVTAVLAWLLVGLVARQARRWGLVQAPNPRSSHSAPTPTAGGLGMVVATLAAGAWLVLAGAGEIGTWLLLSLPLAALGLLDDMRPVSAALRLAAQTAVVAGLLGWMGGPPTLVAGPLTLAGWPLWALVLLAGVWWINLFNFMDGIDGIAAVQAIFMLAAGAVLAVSTQAEAATTPALALAVCTMAAVLGFLVFNWPPAKLFMGDVGSTWLAFMILAFALFSIRAGWLGYAGWLILGAVFAVDATVTLLTRMLRKERWYEAHRSHVYQRLARRWAHDRAGAHRAVTLAVLAIDLLWLAPLAWASVAWPERAALWLVLAYAPLLAGAILLGAGRPDTPDA
jgi:Fuc2NAc and GlcNAc transferase